MYIRDIEILEIQERYINQKIKKKKKLKLTLKRYLEQKKISKFLKNMNFKQILLKKKNISILEKE